MPVAYLPVAVCQLYVYNCSECGCCLPVAVCLTNNCSCPADSSLLVTVAVYLVAVLHVAVPVCDCPACSYLPALFLQLFCMWLSTCGLFLYVAVLPVAVCL